MRHDLMGILACPECKGTLELKVAKEECAEIVEGTLTCSVCKGTYPISDSIPNLLSADMRP